MRKMFLVSMLLIFSFYFSSLVFAGERNFPTDEEIVGIVKTCAGGYSTAIQGNVEAGLKKWVSEAKAKGEGNLTELGGILQTLGTDDAKVTVYKIYVDCIKSTLPQYMGNTSENKSSDSGMNAIIDGVVYEFKGCELKVKIVSCKFSITSQFTDRNINFNGNIVGFIDDKGNSYSLSSIGIANKTDKWAINYLFVADLVTPMTISFDNIATNAEGIGLLTVGKFTVRGVPFIKT